MTYQLGSIIFMETHYGGHLGFFQGGLFWPEKRSSWAEKLTLAYFSSFCDSSDSDESDEFDSD